MGASRHQPGVDTSCRWSSHFRSNEVQSGGEYRGSFLCGRGRGSPWCRAFVLAVMGSWPRSDDDVDHNRPPSASMGTGIESKISGCPSLSEVAWRNASLHLVAVILEGPRHPCHNRGIDLAPSSTPVFSVVKGTDALPLAGVAFSVHRRHPNLAGKEDRHFVVLACNLGDKSISWLVLMAEGST